MRTCASPIAASGDAQDEPATTADIAFPMTATCAPTTSEATGGACELTSSFDAVMPGAIVEGDRAVWQLGALEVFDGGPDGDVDTTPNTLFARQGLFVP